jgi:hypothetical protein
VDSAWKQYKLEVGKLLENTQTPTRRVYALLRGMHGKVVDKIKTSFCAIVVLQNRR